LHKKNHTVIKLFYFLNIKGTKKMRELVIKNKKSTGNKEKSAKMCYGLK